MVEYLYINIGVCMDDHDATIPELWGGGALFLVVLEVPLQVCVRVCLFSIFAPMEQKLLDLE
jgi:hypothetical protein